MRQPWPQIAFALADMFIQMNIKSSFSLASCFFPPSLLTFPQRKLLLHLVVQLFFLTKIR